MNYCTRQDMIDRFDETELIQLTDRNSLGLIDDTVLDLAISDASAEIDGYLSRYDLPLSTVPRVLVRCCCDIARYFLYDDAVIEQVENRYQSIVKFLTQVGKGTISLGPDSSGNQPVVEEGVKMVSGGRVFGRDDKGFI